MTLPPGAGGHPRARGASIDRPVGGRSGRPEDGQGRAAAASLARSIATSWATSTATAEACGSTGA